MKYINYTNDSRWQRCSTLHKAKCKVPNWFIGLLYEEMEFISNIDQIKYALETGTYKGETTEFFCELFEKVYSIEKFPYQNFYGGESLIPLYSDLEKKYLNLKINIGDSSIILPKILENHPNETFLFLFDAHNGPETPLLNELDILNTLSNKKNHVIIIDDWCDFASFHDKIEEKIYNINPNYYIKISEFGRGIAIIYIKK